MKFFLDSVDLAEIRRATIPAKVLHQLMQHPLTDRGLDAFLADWARLPEAKRGL